MNIVKYKGYVNQEDNWEGVGIIVAANSHQVRGEFHQDELHGTAKLTCDDGNTYWG